MAEKLVWHLTGKDYDFFRGDFLKSIKLQLFKLNVEQNNMPPQAKISIFPDRYLFKHCKFMLLFFSLPRLKSMYTV